MEILFVALRNVFRNPRRTILNVVAVGVGVMVIVSLQAWIHGLTQTVYESQMDIDTAHVQILNKGYEDEAARLPLDLGVTSTSAVEDLVRKLPGVVAVGARIDFPAQITNGETGVPVQVRGVDPDAEAKLTTVRKNLVQGAWFQTPNDVVVGGDLAKKLGLHVGQQIFLTALDKYGVRNLVAGNVSGIFSLGFSLFDEHIVLTTLAKARETLSLDPDFSTRVVVRFRSSLDTAGETVRVAKAVAEDAALSQEPLKVYEWKEFAQTMVSSIDGRIRIITFMLGILVFLVAVGILNSMSMSVQERFREIGTLRAIGMNRRKLTRLFLAEGMFLGALGGLVGVAAAGGLSVLFSGGVDVKNLIPKDIPIPFTSVLRPLYNPTDFVLAVVFAALVALIGAWLPARRAGKLKVVDALGSHL